MGNTVVKKIGKKKYLYYVYFKNGRKFEKSCGLASKKESKKKAIELEINELETIKNDAIKRIKQLKSKLAKNIS